MTTIRVSFSLDDERDADIRDWLKRHQHSNRSAAIRRALRQAIRPAAQPDIRRILREELAGLARIEGEGHTSDSADQSQEDPELVAALDEMF